MTITCILALASLVLWILSAIGKAPAWVAGILLSIALLLGCFPR